MQWRSSHSRPVISATPAALRDLCQSPFRRSGAEFAGVIVTGKQLPDGRDLQLWWWVSR